MGPLKRLPFNLLALAAIAVGTPAIADETLDRARALLNNDAAAAFALLEPLETQRAGDPDYDFLLALAALDSGERTRAVFALERVLALQPDNGRARAELARAYLLLGEKRAAREEFERVKSQGVPDSVASTIDRLLAMIEHAENLNRPTLNGHLELSIGRDSNVNSATDNASIAVPGLGVATLNADSVEAGDSFAALAGGLAYRHPLSGGHSLTANLSGTLRRNRDLDRFDTGSLDGAVGWQLARGPDTVSLAGTASSFSRDSDRLRDSVGISGQWQHDYDAVRQGTVFVQYASLSYPEQSVRDVDRAVIGAGYAQAVAARTVVFGSAYGGQEAEKEKRFPHLGHQLAGLRGGIQHRLDLQWTVMGNLSYESRRYGGQEPLFNVRRADGQFEAGIGLSYQIDRRWRLGTRVAYVDNASNVVVYDYRRTIGSLSARADF